MPWVHVLPLCLPYLSVFSASSFGIGMWFFSSLMDHPLDKEATPFSSTLAESTQRLRLPSTLSLMLFLTVICLESWPSPLGKRDSEIIWCISLSVIAQAQCFQLLRTQERWNMVEFSHKWYKRFVYGNCELKIDKCGLYLCFCCLLQAAARRRVCTMSVCSGEMCGIWLFFFFSLDRGVWNVHGLRCCEPGPGLLLDPFDLLQIGWLF